jgi:hypothetical protein
VENGRLVVQDRAGWAELPLGLGQGIRLQSDGTSAVIVRVETDGGRSIKATIRAVRAELTAGDEIRIAGGADGVSTVTVLAGPVQILRGAAGTAHTVQTGESFSALGDAPAPPEKTEAAPAPKPAREPKPVARREKAPPPSEEEPPPVPQVPAIDDTVEASPMR